MIDWSKNWRDIQVLEVDPRWVDAVKAYRVKNDARIQDLLSKHMLGMEIWPIVTKSTDMSNLRFATVLLEFVTAYVETIDESGAYVKFVFRNEASFDKLKQMDVGDPQQYFVAFPRCYVKAGQIERIVTFDFRRTPK